MLMKQSATDNELHIMEDIMLLMRMAVYYYENIMIFAGHVGSLILTIIWNE